MTQDQAVTNLKNDLMHHKRDSGAQITLAEITFLENNTKFILYWDFEKKEYKTVSLQRR